MSDDTMYNQLDADLAAAQPQPRRSNGITYSGGVKGNQMKIEIGKRYVDREGAEIEIIGKQDDKDYPFFGKNADGEDCSFTLDGHYMRSGSCVYDLVTPTPAPTAAPPACPLWQHLRDTWKGGSVLPKASNVRKDFPLWSGFDAYFPAAIVAVAGWSKTANEKHNPGLPLQHARGKSADHQDCQRRHAIDSADPTCDKLEELTCKAWRALAELQEYAETLGAPPAPAATFPETQK